MPDLRDLGPAEEAFGVTHIEVVDWVGAHAIAKASGLSYFDWLSAYDNRDAGLAVVSHLWSLTERRGVLLRTRVERGAPRLPTVTSVFRGAAWHERETFEMFGVVFDGHPQLVPLLLPDGFEGHPLRKEFVLASRLAKEWPGAREPGESAHDAPKRKRMLPPGVPDYDEWGTGWR
jgi:NADH-quinone oxidoreductase subunit C